MITRLGRAAQPGSSAVAANPADPPRCKHYKSTNLTTRWQVFADGTRHLRQECARCGAFRRYLPQRKAVPHG
jgi:hypothetical protein